ncbi:uncharacterized protein PV09_00456 [Verruconis gallopava]|uniref:Myb-like domain-containing protein n=1 Tax=Verruconis gallopava TaxID=253628 RepID=A0A0D2BDX1_9PEZI|nr:uncharacterized protein PV09_00456 [Verruconis gallopava]KIW09584.1 hypothetical protein PV09_00456 [Verruconis gallopava]
MATMALQSQMAQPMAPLSDLTRHDSLASRGRKMTPSGGNRSWSEEEENYLLQTRAQKMPYKHIAAHLKKTELACRLHYHQLSHGSHRRKRTSSLSSSSSAGSVRHSPTQYHLNGDIHEDFRHGTLHSQAHFYSSLSPLGSYPVGGALGSRTQHKVLLPKPRPLTPEESPNRLGGLRISTHESPNGSSVDTDRLRQIYDSRRGSFWSSIAQEYGTDISPSHLEEVWRHQPNGQPPTPDDSPNGRPAMHPMLQSSPFPSFAPTLHSSVKDFAPMSLPSNAPSHDRYSYGIHAADGGYGGASTMGLGRANSWSGGVHQPATAITSLLTEDKCPRHGSDTRYCVGGRCV